MATLFIQEELLENMLASASEGIGDLPKDYRVAALHMILQGNNIHVGEPRHLTVDEVEKLTQKLHAQLKALQEMRDSHQS